MEPLFSFAYNLAALAAGTREANYFA